MMLPFKLSPAYKDYLWGGTKLKTDYYKESTLAVVAESWELSAHPDGGASIATGKLAGMPFERFVQEKGSLLGTDYPTSEEFPILIKLIDAKNCLSIQVHPDDTYARRVEHGQGKTEMWYILDCEPDAFLYFGFEREISPDEARRRIADNTITEVLHKSPVKRGDTFFIRAGTVHAIGAGIVLAEIQQNSNTTYRVSDFGRLGADGKPRALHVEKALAVSDLAPANMVAPGAGEAENGAGYTARRLASCDYFTVERVRLSGAYERQMDGTTFVAVLCVAGNAALLCGGALLPLRQGDCAFVPADCGGFTLDGAGELLLTTL